MTLAQLRAFLAAYDRLTFTAAAERLATTQASVSELIARLERELGTPLFIRGSRRLVPTPAAQVLREHAAVAVTSIEAGMDSLHSMSSLETGVCTFGVLRNAPYYNLADLAQQFHSQYPKVKLRLVGLNSALVAESVASGEVEAGIVVLPVRTSGLRVEPLFRDEVLYASSTRRSEAPVTLTDVVASPLVLYDAHVGWADPTRRQLRERAESMGVQLEPDIEVEHVETAISLVAGSDAGTIVSRAVAESPTFPSGLSVAPFKDPLVDTIALIRRASGHLSPATRRLAELAQASLLSQKGR